MNMCGTTLVYIYIYIYIGLIHPGGTVAPAVPACPAPRVPVDAGVGPWVLSVLLSGAWVIKRSSCRLCAGVSMLVCIMERP